MARHTRANGSKQGEWILRIVLTKLDVLAGLDEIKICIGYELDGRPITMLPSVPRMSHAAYLFTRHSRIRGNKRR